MYRLQTGLLIRALTLNIAPPSILVGIVVRTERSTCCSLLQPTNSHGSDTLPFVSRAQPRDLQFCGLVLGMFFDSVLMQVR